MEINIDSYKFFDNFLHKVFIESKSFITKENESINLNSELLKVKESFINNPIGGNHISFDKKLVKQFQNENNTTKLLFANIYYLYNFAQSDIRKEKKTENLQLVLQGTNKNIIHIPTHGIANFGMYYKMNKYFEIYSLIEIFEYLLDNKNSYVNVPDIKALIEDFCLKAIYNKNTIEKYLPKSGKKIKTCNIYNALLNLSNNNYEAIVSYGHKKKIVSALSKKYLSAESKTKNTDEKIMEIKKAIIKEGQYWGWKDKNEKTRGFFYGSKLKDEWLFKKEMNLNDLMKHNSEKAEISDDKKINATAQADYIQYQRKALLVKYKTKHNKLEKSFKKFLENTLEKQNLDSIKQDINYIDYQFKDKDTHYICELKPSNTDKKSIKYSIRSSLGQLLEYSFKQEEKNKDSNIGKIIVFQHNPTDDNLKFLNHLKEKFGIYYLYEESEGVFKGNAIIGIK